MSAATSKHVRLWALPGVLIVLMLASLLPGLERRLGFDLAVLPLLIGGVKVVYATVLAVLSTKRITAGVLVVVALIGTVFVEEYIAGAVVALMMIIGETLEEITLEKTRNAVRELVRLAPQQATVWVQGEWREVPIEDIAVGDRVLVRPGGRVPVDGKVASGQASLNQAALTGESMPVDRTVGDPVFVGTFVDSGAIEIVAEKVGADTTLGRIIQVVLEAQSRKGPSQRIADRFAARFTPAILVISALVWIGTGEMMRAMTVLVIACPCALVLATPTAVVAAVGNAARRGVMIKGGDVIEQAGRVDTLLLDKTGTITWGKPEVLDLATFSDLPAPEVLSLAAAAEERSEHPIGRAIRSKARDTGVTWPEPADFAQLFGVGVRARVNGGEVLVGNRRALDPLALASAAAPAPAPPSPSPEVLEYLDRQESLGRSPLLVIRDGTVVGGLAVADTVRPHTGDTLARIRALGIKSLALVTGDHRVVAEAVARETGLQEVHAGMMPVDKLALVEKLRREGRVVGMIGDGVNDAPALISADLGIAMGAAGTEVAIESAGIALMGDDLRQVVHVLALSRRTVSTIKQNIWAFSLAVNIVGVALASYGMLTPIWAAVAHNAASVLVVLNSTRLLTFGRARTAA